MATILETPRMILREMDEGDLDFLASLLGDPQVMRFYPKPLDRAEALGWLRKNLSFYAQAGHGFWLAISRETGQPMGQVGLLPMEIHGKPEVEVAYMFHRPFWRLGLASEAAQACVNYGLDTLKLEKVVCIIRPENLPSLGVGAKLGLRRIGETTHMGFLHHLFEIRKAGP